MADDDQSTFRAELLQTLPWWLRGWLGGRVAYAIGIVIDAVADMLTEAVMLRFPRSGQADALAPIGADRKIPRGPNESAAIYIVRLRRWLDDHRTRGGPYAMLAQLHAYWSANPFLIILDFANNYSYEMQPDGSISRGPGGGYNDAPTWAHWRLRFVWPNALSDDGHWNDPGTWSDGGVWDSGLTPVEVADIRCVPTAWNAAHATGKVVLLGSNSVSNVVSISQGV